MLKKEQRGSAGRWHIQGADTETLDNSDDRWLRYMDHATTAAVRAPDVVHSLVQALSEGAISPGRSAHHFSSHANELLDQARADVAHFFGCSRPNRLIFTHGATESLNLAIKGFLRPGDHVVASCFDHASVLRPLTRMVDNGIQLTIVRAPRPDNELVEAIARELRPHTRLVTVNHASNVFGWLLPVQQIAAVAHAAGAIVLLDAAQSAGHVPINVSELPVDLLAIGSHKGLLGPPGVGALLVNNDEIELVPVIDGGTGYVSELLRPPNVFPVSYEAGTPNVPAIAGMAAAVRFLEGPDFTASYGKAVAAWERAVRTLGTVGSVDVYGGIDLPSIPVVSFTVGGVTPHRCAQILDQEFGIQVRAGLHCAPLAHDTVGTSPHGTVRASFGYGNDVASADYLYAAVDELSQRVNP